MTLAVFVPAALLAVVLGALLLIGWWLLDRMHFSSPRAKGTGDASPPCAPLVPARVREIVTGDERPLLTLIDSERNRP